MELLDQINHRKQQLKLTLRDLSDFCDKYASGKTLENQYNLLLKRQDILNTLTNIYQRTQISALGDFRNLIENNVFIPIGELVKNNLDTNQFKKQYAYSLDEMKSNRLGKDKRKEEDAIFHYKVDVLNSTLSMVYNNSNNKNPILFTTFQKENIEICTNDLVSYGRHPIVPLFIQNLSILLRKNFISDKNDFLEEAFLQASEISHRLKQPTLSVLDYKKVVQFYENYISRYPLAELIIFIVRPQKMKCSCLS